MNKYRNTKTGAVIETVSVVSGGDWVEVKEAQKKTTARKAVKKNGSTGNSK